MNSVSYNFYDAYKVRIDGLSPWTVQDLNCKYLWFREKQIETPDLHVEIGRFKPDCSLTRNIDQRYMLRKDYLYLRECVKGLRFEAEIFGMDSDTTHIRYHMSPWNRTKMPWVLFPDLILHLYVLQPFIECKLAQRGIYLLHSAGFVKDEKAMLVAGRGGSAKTSFAMGLLRRGFSLLGDDMVALSGNRLLPHPMTTNWLAFLTHHCASDRMQFAEMVRLFFYLRSRHEAADLPYAAHAKMRSLNLIYQADVKVPQRTAVSSTRETMNALRCNHELERLTYVSYKYDTWRFLNTYGYLYPDHCVNHFWDGWMRTVGGIIDQCPVQRLDIPSKWDDEYVSLLI